MHRGLVAVGLAAGAWLGGLRRHEQRVLVPGAYPRVMPLLVMVICWPGWIRLGSSPSTALFASYSPP